MKVITFDNLSGNLAASFSPHPVEIFNSKAVSQTQKAKVGFFLYANSGLEEVFPTISSFTPERVYSVFWSEDRDWDRPLSTEELKSARAKYAKKVLSRNLERTSKLSPMMTSFISGFDLLRGTSKSSHPESEGINVYPEEAWNTFRDELIYRLGKRTDITKIPSDGTRWFIVNQRLYIGSWNSPEVRLVKPEDLIIYTEPLIFLLQSLLDNSNGEIDSIKIITEKETIELRSKEEMYSFVDLVNSALCPITFRPISTVESKMSYTLFPDWSQSFWKDSPPHYAYVVDDSEAYRKILRIHYKDLFFEEIGHRKPWMAFKCVLPLKIEEIDIVLASRVFRIFTLGRFSRISDDLVHDTVNKLKTFNFYEEKD